MAKRTGIPTLQKVAHQLCKYLSKYTTVITLLYPDNGTLLAAMAAAHTACAVLEQELALVRDYGD